jgi:hypothetical protein
MGETWTTGKPDYFKEVREALRVDIDRSRNL